jgi:hypothetical protein
MKVQFNVCRNLTNFADQFRPMGIPDNVTLYNTYRIDKGIQVTMEETDHPLGKDYSVMMIVGSKIGTDLDTLNRWLQNGYIKIIEA